MIFRVPPWLDPFVTRSGGRVGVAKQAIVVAGLLAVGADVDRHLAAASGLDALAGVFFEGQTTGV